MGSLPPLLLIGTCLIGLGNLLHIIGFATPHWQQIDRLNVKRNYGLFKACVEKPRNVGCRDYKGNSSELEAVQAMASLGLLCGIAGSVSALWVVFFTIRSKSGSKIFSLVCPSACIAALVFIIIAVAVYADKIYDDAYDYGYSFALTIVGGILMAAGGPLVFIGTKSISYPNRHRSCDMAVSELGATHQDPDPDALGLI